MAKSIGRGGVAAIFAVGFGLLVAACSGEKQGTAGSGGDGSAGSSGNASSGGASTGGGAGLCVPGTKRCDGLNVKVCDASGVTETIAQTCLPAQSCTNGACVGASCLPNTEVCRDGAVWKCDANGTSALAEQCAPGQFCRTEGDSARCGAQACAPGQPVCDGDRASTCKSDGSGPIAGGTDCSKDKQACYVGQCRDVLCKSGAKLCDHGDVYLCSHNGTETALLTDCNSGEVCDADLGSCRARICEPGKVSCDGTRLQTCNAFGSAWAPGSVDCAADGKICANGGCKKQICGANRSFCQDGSVYNCDSTGTSATLTQTCNAQVERCASYSGGSFAYCKSNDCHAGDTVCSDNTIKVCNADGSLPSNGTPCGDNQYCDNGQCVDRPCVLGSYFCKAKDVYYCDFSSPFVFLAQACDADSACKVLGANSATCAPLACSPASNACLGNQIGTCAADGQGLAQVTTDCSATTSVCTSALTCAKSVTDTLGVAENVEPISPSAVVGDVIDVSSTRKLTEFSTQLVLAGPRELRWLVYELSAQGFVAKADKVVSSAAASGFISSGPLDFKLQAGKRYLLSVVVSGGDAVDYIDAQPFPASVSFGRVIGRVLNFYPGSFDVFSIDYGYVSQMKVTTESP